MHPGAGRLEARSIERIAVGREWKISALSVREL